VLIVMHHKAGEKQINAVLKAVKKMGLTAAPIPGSERTAIGVLGNKGMWTTLPSGTCRGCRR